MRKAIIYCRASVSEEKQKNSHSLQESCCREFAAQNSYEVVKVFSEYASGGDDSRIEFNKALSYAEKNNYTVIVWRIDRLARSLSVFSLIQDKLPLIRSVSLGDTEINITVIALLLSHAHSERVATSIRVKKTYEHLSKQPNHKPWGNPSILKSARPLAMKAKSQNASAFNAHIRTIIDDLKTAGYSSAAAIADRLNNMGLQTRWGKPFTHQTIYRIIRYTDAPKAC